jgi:redox-regulated HSP33 family molecular chaperone
MPGLGDGSLALLRETSMKKMTKKLVLKKETVSTMLYQVTGGATLRCYTAVCTNDSCPCSNAQYAC